MSPEHTAMDQWLGILWDQGGSDLLLAGGSPPRLRVNGRLRPIEGAPPLSGDEIDAMARPLLTPGQIEIFKEQLDVDFSFSYLDRARIRGSIFTQRGQTALALRLIPSEIPSFDDLGLPLAAEMISELPEASSCSLAPPVPASPPRWPRSSIKINTKRACHILTIEDPVEYVHNHKMSAVSQREVGLDSPSFDRALRSALREDPDVLLIGEMRDIDSIQIALTMAETGHLVFATLHTNDAPGDRPNHRRLPGLAPGADEGAARIVAERRHRAEAHPKIGGGMVAAYEVLIATNPVRNLIREGRSNQISNVMFTNTKEGMQTMENSLAILINDGVVTYEDALAVTAHPKELVRTLSKWVRRPQSG
jgi:twitching motility protein PilT